MKKPIESTETTITTTENFSFESETNYSCLEYLIVLALYFWVIVPLIALWTQRNLNFWLTHFSGHAVHVPFVLDYLLSVLAPAVILLNVIAEIARHCI